MAINVDRSYSSSVLFTPTFKASDDLIISFLYSDPDSNILGTLQQEDQSNLLLEDGNNLNLNFNKGSSPYLDGISVFIIDADSTASSASLVGGGNNDDPNSSPGLGIVTDTIVTSSSAVSGLLAIAALDFSGEFSKTGSLSTFTDGESTATATTSGHFAVRIPDRGSLATSTPSAFPYKGRQVMQNLTIDEKYKLCTVGFKRHLQDIIYYIRHEDGLKPSKIFNTDISLHHLPTYIRLGFSCSSTMPIELKNITVNGTLLA